MDCGKGAGMTDFSQNLGGLLGQPIDDPDVSKFLESVDPNEKVFLTDLKEPRWQSQKGGLVVYADKKTSRITTLYFYAEGHEGRRQFVGPLPRGIAFSMARPQVLSTIADKPDFSKPERDTWDQSGVRLVVRYNKESSAIELVTLFVLP
jgi:hypothetical protein